MKIENLTEFYSFNPPATIEALNAAEAALRSPLPSDFRDLLTLVDGFLLDSGVEVYGAEKIEERNATFEVAQYALGYLAVGDDSGGRAIMLKLDEGRVFVVDQGVMVPDEMLVLADSLQDWIDAGCELA